MAANPELKDDDMGRVNRALLRLAIGNLFRAPGRFARGCVGRLLRWFLYSPLLCAAFLVALARRPLKARGWTIAAIPSYLALIHAPLSLSARLIVPAVPVMCVIAGCLIASLLGCDQGDGGNPWARERLEAMRRPMLGWSAVVYVFSLWACL